METLLVIAQHRNQGYSRSKGYTHGFCSPPSTVFKGMNCRAFQSYAGILQSPPPISPSKSLQVRSEPPKPSRRSNPITICSNPCPKHFTFSGSCSELWAGPTYSNSPAPSSLPIPKLSLRQKRSILPQPEVNSASADFFLTENLRRILNLDPEN